jgi:signal transduction histidine kinase
MSVLPDTSQFLPHGVCLSWNPNLVAAMAASQALLGLAYISVAATLGIFTWKRRDFPFPMLLALFAVVFAACGVSHLTDVLTLWVPAYVAQVAFKVVVALFSVPAAVAMWALLPAALALPSPQALRAARDSAEQASRAKSHFLATMSHELRTPLNAILGFSEALALRMFGPLNDRQADYVTSIRSSGGHLLRLINDILDLTKVDAGRMELDEGTVDLAAVAMDAANLVRGHAQDAGVALTVEVSTRLPKVTGDALRLKQVVLNLLSNAVKFTPSGGAVHIGGVEAADGSVRLAVVDSGIGMDPEDIPRVFTMFTQVAGPLARSHGGSGIGLPLSKALVELHGGRLEIDSALGRGTRAEVVLPAERVLAHPRDGAGVA